MLTHKLGDKVRIKNSPARGLRGVIAAVRANLLVIKDQATGHQLEVQPDNVTNFSLAARKAWKRMPDRRVGRPKGSVVCDRVSVTVRLDRDLWEAFRQAEADGIVTDRTATINSVLREHLDRIPLRPKKIAS